MTCLEDSSTSKKHAGPSESTDHDIPHQQPAENISSPYLESITNVKAGVEKYALSDITTFDSIHEAPLQDIPMPVMSALIQPIPLQAIEKPHINKTNAASPTSPKSNDQANGKGVLKGKVWCFFPQISIFSLANLDVYLECSLPCQFSDKLMLHIIHDDSSEVLHCTRISPTKWKVDGIITL